MLRKPRIKRQEPELDITSFMNLMIVLVPVLLMMMVFSHITVLELKLPGLTELTQANAELDENDQLEVIVRANAINVYYPQGKLVNVVRREDSGYDFDTYVKTLKTIKALLRKNNIDKKDLSLLLEPDVDYQTIVTLMDKSRSYKDVVVASVVNAELFPDVSLGDAPALKSANTNTGGGQ